MNALNPFKSAPMPHAWATGPQSYPPRLNLMIEGFFDDSGKQSDSNFVCAAGFLADTTYWTKFVIEWQHLLLRWGIAEIHMKDLMASKKAFTGWDDQKKYKAISEFVDVINSNKLIGVGVGVDAKFWGGMPRSVTKTLGTAQQFCFTRIIKNIRSFIISSGSHDVFTATFDYDKEFCASRLARFHDILEKDPWARERFVSIGFARAKAYQPLQAADMLAWESKRWQEVIQKGARPSFARSTMFKGPDGIEFAAAEYWGETEIRQHIDMENGEIKTDPTAS
jgi:hypothetical protein